MAPRNQLLNRSKALFAGRDEGAYTLPADLMSYWDAIPRLREMQVAANQRAMAADPGAVRSRLAALLPDAVRKGNVPDGWIEDLNRAQEAQIRAGAEYAVLGEAVGLAESLLVRVINSSADELITDNLRPAMDEVLDGVRKAIEAAKGDPTTLPPRALARADKPVRDAFVVIEEAAERYGLIRSAQTAIQSVTGDVDADAWALFAEFKNLPALWPNFAWRQPGNVPPWPREAAPRMVWLLRPEVGVWMPTSVECNDAYTQYVRFAGTNNPRMEGIRAMPVEPTSVLTK